MEARGYSTFYLEHNCESPGSSGRREASQATELRWAAIGRARLDQEDASSPANGPHGPTWHPHGKEWLNLRPEGGQWRSPEPAKRRNSPEKVACAKISRHRSPVRWLRSAVKGSFRISSFEFPNLTELWTLCAPRKR